MAISTDKILVPVDFSEPSVKALAEAHSLLADGGTLTVVHVLPELHALAPGVVWGQDSDERRIERSREALQKILDDQGLTAELELRVDDIGNAAHVIVKVAEELGIDLIVMPTHGRTGLRRIAIGSVAERVVRLSRVPVLVLRS